jgi:hypothetical protein
VKVGIRELRISARAEIEIDRIENGGLAAITRTNEAIDARPWQPRQLFDAAEILNGDLANVGHVNA